MNPPVVPTGNRLRIGSLFSGYAGLDMAVADCLNGEPVWFVDNDPAASAVLAHHWPNVPNHGDITTIDWGTVEPVDVLTGGTPCQDLSSAGKRAGMTEGTRSNLWVNMREAVAALQPRFVVWENVRGALSTGAHSEVEREPGRVGDGTTGPALRALGRVLGDLADLGYDAGWYGLRAASVGAPHGRFRVFVLAWPAAYAGGAARQGRGGLLPLEPAGHGWGQSSRSGRQADSVALFPTPRSTDGTKGGPNQRGSSGDLMLPSAVALLPTPAVNDMGAGYTPDGWDAWRRRMRAEHGNGNGHGDSLSIEARRLLPTPLRADGAAARNATANRSAGSKPAHSGTTLVDLFEPVDDAGHAPCRAGFGKYAPAIQRWETATGRTVPDPTEPTGRNGRAQLSPRFVEWMMGLPDGHVTGCGLSRAKALGVLGNGVVPAQAKAALTVLVNAAMLEPEPASR